MYTAQYDDAATFGEQVRSAAGVEVHRKDISVANEPFEKGLPFQEGLTPFIFQLAGGPSSRIGQVIHPLSIDGHIVLKGRGVDTTFTQVRVGIVQYNIDANVSEFDAENLLQVTSFPMGVYQLEEKDKYTVVWDAYVTLSNNSASPLYLSTLPVSIDISQNPQPTYRANVEAKFQYYIYALTDEAGDSPPLFSCSLNCLYTST